MKEKALKIRILEKSLRFLARAVIRKYKPMVVGITGSVGKTSAKEAIALVLSSKFRVRKSEKNYNNEIGVPLTILCTEGGGGSWLEWGKVFLRGISLLIFPVKYPEVLVLEMAVDKPGDMDYLLSFALPDIGVITNISVSHLEFFGSLENIAKEKGKLIRAVKDEGVAVINGDDKYAMKIDRNPAVDAVEFGFNEGLEVQATDANFNYVDGKISGVSFKLNYQGKIIPFRLPHILAFHQIYAILAAIAVGLQMKINLVDMAQAVENFSPPCGRMNLLEGKNNSQIIDDTYNSSPVSTIAALKTITGISAKRRIAVLGDMLELGNNSEAGHLEVISKAFTSEIELIFLVGKRMKKALEKYLKANEIARNEMKNVFSFDDPSSAGQDLEKLIKENDLVLVKGSQSMRMEKIVKKIVSQSVDAKKMLCRQTAEWREKPFVEP